ncbi:MAG: membrane protein insertion efficiency factor YidD [Mycobacteriales bacterium]
MTRLGGCVARAIVAPIRAYQRYVSPLRMPACRFTPSCSEYAVQALTVHGPLRGGWLALRRLLRCHPYHRGGHDPVPPAAPPTAQAPRRSTEIGDPRC